MISGMIGEKKGMTQLFDDNGQVVPVTVIKAGPCVVVQKKIQEKNNQMKVQLGLVQDKKLKNLTKPQEGHFARAKVPPTRILKEFMTDKDDVSIGDTVKVDIFEESEKVSVVGFSKGKGFQGVVKRWNFSGGKASHGSMFHRRPGAIGMCAYPGKVHKGKKLPGRMGGKRRTVQGLKVIRVDLENNLLLVKGPVPGFNGNFVMITKEAFKRR